ncbi:MAG TPA: DUF488 domain-containing protein [Ktedonobacteraceae bacterium]|nr:DUF488 domain-containing protein [Ktedonobacteraceae bacterium]
MSPKIVTIGVYGFDEQGFFKALLDAKIDIFCDIRLRRGMRGSIYAFANSTYLQRRLGESGIRYLHIKELAPNQAIREQQQQEDKKLGIAKRTRKELGQAFIQAYERECLASFDSGEFIKQVGQDAKVIGLFCVEREPEACHRSLAAQKLARDLDMPVDHIKA